jgi:hypothetical protein
MKRLTVQLYRVVALMGVAAFLVVACTTAKPGMPPTGPLQQIQAGLVQLLKGQPILALVQDMQSIVTTVAAKVAAGQETTIQAQLDLACPNQVLAYIAGIQQAIGGIPIPAGAGVGWLIYTLNNVQTTQLNQLAQGTKLVVGTCQAFFHLPGLPI